MKFFKFIYQDQVSNHLNPKGKTVMLLFRIANYTSINRTAKYLLYPYLFFYRGLVEWIFGIEIPYQTSIGEGLTLYHGQALVINAGTIIGRNCIIRHCTTIGNNGRVEGSPHIGDNVEIGSNVCIIGPITIGDNVVIGAGCVLTKSIPSNSIVVGNPARIIQQKWDLMES
ncbi:serine acetyltransferase [Spirosoma utsteinense]|uniref:Serine acetyltransferase n=1 Tax=Spirosoma utsteinense TaxID=2585773 RepID=A0ABR6WAT4_9BACT|nr:serine O-acetyltransferase [Spirosoma utsteinense]MBC3787415.1 putative colanic acid biosynthesis acetyltransferase WcaB [Spirosoma utsteinense]MBC3793030.1 putative colanic acid biosynthesis acetyltransferase WcaB [Spirosoma utsteinense]